MFLLIAGLVIGILYGERWARGGRLMSAGPRCERDLTRAPPFLPCRPHAALVGYVVYPTQVLQSGTLPFEALNNLNGTFGNVSMATYQCIPLAVPNGQPLPAVDPLRVSEARGAGGRGRSPVLACTHPSHSARRAAEAPRALPLLLRRRGGAVQRLPEQHHHHQLAAARVPARLRHCAPVRHG